MTLLIYGKNMFLNNLKGGILLEKASFRDTKELISFFE